MNISIETHYRVLIMHSALWKGSKFRIFTTLTHQQTKKRVSFSPPYIFHKHIFHESPFPGGWTVAITSFLWPCFES